MTTEIINAISTENLIGNRTGITEIRCERCASLYKPASIAGPRTCTKCGGSLIGIRIFRNALTGKILYAERAEL